MTEAVDRLAHVTTAVSAAIRREQATGISYPITRRLTRSRLLGASCGRIGGAAGRLAALKG